MYLIARLQHTHLPLYKVRQEQTFRPATELTTRGELRGRATGATALYKFAFHVWIWKSLNFNQVWISKTKFKWALPRVHENTKSLIKSARLVKEYKWVFRAS